MIGKVISGGQTGVDRAALDVAIEYGIPHGGYCTKGRRAEDGRIPDKYNLIELPTADYPARTRKNVRAADAVLILTWDYYPLTGGTRLTAHFCKLFGIRHDTFRLARMGWTQTIHLNSFHAAIHEPLPDGEDNWTLMIAGPRESKHPGIYAAAMEFLRQVLPDMRKENP